jgi:hypothetical protein
MKKSLTSLIWIFAIYSASAQTEIKVCPIAVLFGVFAGSAETAVSESFGLDGDVIALSDFFGFNISGKYYFNPVRRIDGFHIGMYGGNIADGSMGVGFLIGYKWLSRKNVLFELGIGGGRSFEGAGSVYGKAHVGYRFHQAAKQAPPSVE